MSQARRRQPRQPPQQAAVVVVDAVEIFRFTKRPMAENTGDLRPTISGCLTLVRPAAILRTTARWGVLAAVIYPPSPWTRKMRMLSTVALPFSGERRIPV